MQEVFGSVRVAKVETSEELKHLLKGVVPESDVYVVKPNWYSPLKGGFTDADALDLLLSALPGKKIVIEGYSLDRQDGSSTYRSDGVKVDYRWVLRNPGLGWLMGDVLETMRRQDQWFRDSLGLTKVFEKHGVEYVSVTEEVLAGRVEPAEEVKKRVESRYPSLQHEILYGYMSSKLVEYMGAPLISFGHVKGYCSGYPSLTLKNMFGLIPDPMRSWWHGTRDSQLNQSIVDTVKLYSAYFQLAGVAEAFNSYTISDPNGEVKAPWGAYHVGDGGGFVACGGNLVDLDAVTSALIRVDPEKVGYIKLAEEVFGKYQRDTVALATAQSSKWFTGS